MQVAHSLASPFPAASPPPPSQPQPAMYGASPHGLMAAPGFSRSFSDLGAFPQHALDKPQIYTAVYSGVSVYEMEVNRVAVMRRRSDGWLNATQILKVAGVDKGKRTKVLEKEILTGEHEKVQGGYGKYQGTWINYRRGREFCRQYGVEDILRPLLDYDISADGNATHGLETPTKEQAMAANRKRFYTQSIDGRPQSQSIGGTFFSNISSTATSALAAMNKVARLNSPAPHPASSSQGRRSVARPSQGPPMPSQDSFRTNSQQSAPSMASERSFSGANGHADSAYGTGIDDAQEPPRKRMRASQDESYSQPTGAADLALLDHGSPTEPSESFYRQTGHHISLPDGEVPTALPPLPYPDNKLSEEKQAMLTDLFADQTRTDFTNHPAILHLSGADLDMPIDNSSNTALHWAATLARVSLMRLLVSKGANMFRGSASGQTPLMSAVSVNNSLDHSCFPETLEILAPLIELRDTQGRTILHHIAVTCAIKGRAASSKYYLEALLEYLVRSNIGAGQLTSFRDSSNYSKPIGLMRFMQEMVNARDKAGNTALNLAARIGNRNIISQLMEVQADPTIPNHKGTRPIDFGVGSDLHGDGETTAAISSPSKGKAPLSKVEETSREIQPLMNGILQSASMQFTQEARLKQDSIDRTNESIAQLSALQKTEQQKLETLRLRLRTRQDRAKRISNLKRWLEPQRHMLSTINAGAGDLHEKRKIGYADAEGAGIIIKEEDLPYELRQAGEHLIRQASGGPAYLSTPLPLSHLSPSDTQLSPLVQSISTSVLRHRIDMYTQANAALLNRSRKLKDKDGQLEAMFRQVVCLCTNVDESRIDEVLPSLVAALDSDPLDGVEVGRVREFLRKVEGVEARAMTSAYYLAKPPRSSSSPSPPSMAFPLDELPTLAVPLEDLPTLSLLYKLNKIDSSNSSSTYTPNASFNDRISVIRQDITTLATDAIVNAANTSLLGGGGVDGAIHRAAGPDLVAECETLYGCATGSAKITDGYNLPARKVIHAVGPVYFAKTPAQAAELLASCYTTSLQLAVQHGCRSIAFSALSTGMYGYPSGKASVVALESVRRFFEEGEGADALERVVFCNFLEKDEKAYSENLPTFFPPVSAATPEPATRLDESILTDADIEAETEADAGEHPTEILSQLPDAPTADPIDPPEATGPEPKKQKTVEDPDTDDGFVLVDKEEARNGKKGEL